MKKNVTTMTLLKLTMGTFIFILGIHFVGILLAVKQAGDINELEGNGKVIKASFQSGLDSTKILRYHPKPPQIDCNTCPRDTKKKTLTLKEPIFDPLPYQPPTNSDPDIVTNPFAGVKVIQYWSPNQVGLTDTTSRYSIPSEKRNGKIAWDSLHLAAFTAILQYALWSNSNVGQVDINKIIDSDEAFLMIPNSELPLSSEVPPEKQIDPNVYINGDEIPITAVLKTNTVESYILIRCKRKILQSNEQIILINIGNPNPQPFDIKINKPINDNGIEIIRKFK